MQIWQKFGAHKPANQPLWIEFEGRIKWKNKSFMSEHQSRFKPKLKQAQTLIFSPFPKSVTWKEKEKVCQISNYIIYLIFAIVVIHPEAEKCLLSFPVFVSGTWIAVS